MAAEAATAAAVNIPAWLWAFIGAGGVLFFTFVLGIIRDLVNRDKSPDRGNHDACPGCSKVGELSTSVSEIRGLLNQLLVALGVGNLRGPS